MHSTATLHPSETRTHVKTITLDHPWRWLAAGWADMTTVPGLSFAYGGVFALVGFALLFGLEMAGIGYLILPMGLGFAIIGPAAAVGLYETSRRLEAGQPVGLAQAFGGFARNGSQIALVGAFLLIAFLAWCRLAMLEFMLFFGSSPPPLGDLPAQLLLSEHSAGFLLIGTVTGGAIALAMFAMTAIAVPMLMDRKTDAMTAMLTSLETVRHNPRPMMLWAGLIAFLTFFGLALFFVGLVITLPLIGHASWHAYRDLVDM